MPQLLLHLVRHGVTDWNVAGRVQGHSDSALTALGHEQAQAVGRALVRYRLTALYASDATRAQQTAAHIAAHVGLEVHTEPGLRESGFGVLEGLTWAEIEAQHPQIFQRLRSDDATFAPPGGESRAQTLDRACATIERLAERHPGGRVAAVTHGGVMGFFLRHVLSIPLGQRLPIKTVNGNVSTFERTDAGWRLVKWGANDHLIELETA